MTKRKSTKKRALNNNGQVLVKSRTYGEHYRAARGTNKRAMLNEAFTAHAEKTAVVNAAAKTVYAALKLYSEGFSEGQLWQAMLSRMRKTGDAGFENLLHSLEGLELNSRYPLKRFGNVPIVVAENGKKTLDVQVRCSMPPVLFKHDNCYAYTLIALLFDSKGVCVHHAAAKTQWMNRNEKPDVFDFCFDKPARAKHNLLCLQFDSGKDGVAANTLAARGMSVV